MPEEHHLQTVDRQRVIAPITLRVTTAPSSTTVTAVTETGTIGPTQGIDLLDCLINLRRELEAHGLLLCCQGARINVWPSGQLRQFTDGRQGYVLTETGTRTPDDPFDIVDLLDPAPADQSASVDDQHRFIRAFHGLPPTPAADEGPPTP